MSDLLDQIGLYNVFEERMQTKKLPRTHTRGSEAIDHIWTTKYILDNIKRAGIAPFGFGYESDHRGLFVDIDDEVLFDKEEIKIMYHDYRRLKTGIPKRIKKYQKHIQKTWDMHKIDEKYDRLQEMISSGCKNDEVQKFINKLDKQISDILIAAEKKCTGVSSHHLSCWSPKLVAAMATKRHWRSKLTQASKLPHKIGLIEAINIYKTTLDRYNEAVEKYNELCQKAKTLRENFLKERSEDVAIKKGTKAEKEIKSIIQTEKQRNQSVRIKKTVRKRSSGGPNSVLIPALTEYQRPLIQHFDHYDIDQIWE